MSARATTAERNARIAELYRSYGPVVYRRCLRILKDPEAARDATQEVFVKLVRDIEKLEDRATVLPWVYRVATNYCLNHYRNTVRRAEEDTDDRPELPSPAPSPVDVYPDQALARSVLARFDAATQAIAVGVIVDGMEHGEVAELLGVSRRTVARKLERFVEHARKYLTRENEAEAQQVEEMDHAAPAARSSVG